MSICKKTGKHRYHSVKDAKAVVKIIRREHNKDSRFYMCDHCGSYHLTTKNYN